VTSSTPIAFDGVDAPAPVRRFGLLIDGCLVVALLALAVVIRRGPLGPRSLWLDDAWPALVTRVAWSRITVVGLTSPGFSAILKAWTHVVGFSDTHAQQPAFAFGVLGPALVYLTGRRMALRTMPALVAATILLVSRNHVIYSSRVKQYTLDALLSTVIILLAVRLLDHPEQVSRWAALVATAALATVASSLVLPTVSGAFLAAFYAAWKRPGARRVAISAVGTYGLFAIAWWAIALRPRINPALRSYWSAFYIRMNLSFPRDLGIALWRLAHGISWAPTLATLIVLVIAAAVVVWRRSELAILLLTPLAVAATLSTLHVAPLGAGRTDVNLYPALALLVGVALGELRMKVPVGLAVAGVLLVALAATNRAAPPYPSENMRGAVAALTSKVRPSDEVLVYWAGRYPFALYARNWGLEIYRSDQTAEGLEVHVERPNLFVLPDDETHKSRYAAVLARLAKNQSRIWFIGSHGRFDVITVEKDLANLGYRSTRRGGDSESAFLTLWTKRP
jgi:Dolichyl-phosphate-mannose-protein mannosyltransferase